MNDGGIHYVTDDGLSTLSAPDLVPVEEAPLQMEVEVDRIGGPDEVDGQRFPRNWGPEVPSLTNMLRARSLSSFGLDDVYPDSRELPGQHPLRVTLKHFLPAGPSLPAGFYKGIVVLSMLNAPGLWLGHQEQVTVWSQPSDVPVQSHVPVTLVFDRKPVNVGLFVVSVRVPLPNEYRPYGGRRAHG